MDDFRLDFKQSGASTNLRYVRVEQGTLALTGDNSGFTGNLYINTDENGNPGLHANATLEARAQSLPTNNSGNTANVKNYGILRFVQDDTGTYVGQIVGTGSVQMNGTGVVTLAPQAGANTYSGGTVIQSGTIAINSDAALGAATGSLTLGSNDAVGTLQLNDNIDIAATRTINLLGEGGAIDTQAFSSTLSQDIAPGNGVLYKEGSGTLTVIGSLEQAGGTFVNNGTLQLGDGGQTGDAGNAVIKLNNQSVLAVNRENNIVLANSIGGTGQVVQRGTGITTLTNNNLYSGGTVIEWGTLAISDNRNLGDAAGSLTFGTASTEGTLRLDNTINLGNRPMTINQGGARIDTNGNNGTITGVITGTGPMTKYGNGVLTFTGDNTYTGKTTVNQGTLKLGDGGTSGNVVGDISVNTGATLALNRSDDTQNLGGVISGGGGVVQMGPGTATFTNENTYTGGTTIQDGTLQLGDGYTAGSIVGNVTNDGTLAFNRNDNVSFPGTISGTGSVEQRGTGTTVLTGTNTYQGGTWIKDGTLAVSGDDNLGDPNGSLTFGTDGQAGTNGTLRLDATTTLSAGRAVTINSGGGTIDTNGNTGTINQAIAGTGGLTKTGDGTLVLNGDNTYSGATTIAKGTLQLGTGGTTGSVQGDIVDNGHLVINRSDPANAPLVLGGVISGTGNLTQKGGGTTILTGENTYTGKTTVTENSTLQVGNGSAVGDIQSREVQVDNGSTFALDHSDNITFGGVFSGGGNVVKKGTGRLDLTGDSGNDFSGDLYVAEGILEVTGSTGNINPNRVVIGADPALNPNMGTLVLSDHGDLSARNEIVIAPTDGETGTLIIGSPVGETPIRPGLAHSDHLSFGKGVGKIIFNHTDLNNYIFDNDLRNGIQSDPTPTPGTDSSIEVHSGVTTLVQDSSAFTGKTNIHGGILRLRRNDPGSTAGSLGGNMETLPGGRLEGNGTVGSFSTTGIGSLVNNGTVAPGFSSFGNPLGNLTVDGNYTGGTTGYLEIQTQLGDDNSPTDKLVVMGDTAGDTMIQVFNYFGHGAQTVEGIEIVDVKGASNGTFHLVSDYIEPGDNLPAVVGGAFGYTLHQGTPSDPGNGNWYLRSLLLPGEPIDPGAFQPGVPIYEVYPQVLLELNRLPTLQQRVGNRYWVSAPSCQRHKACRTIQEGGAWSRVEGATGRLHSGYSTSHAGYDLDTIRVQVGYDKLLMRNGGSKLIGGINYIYGHAYADVCSSVNFKGRIKSDANGLGGTLTRYWQNGLYVDSQAQLLWFDSDIHSYTLNTSEVNGNDGFGYAFGVEIGKRFRWHDAWMVTPQAQLMYSGVSFSTFHDAYNARIALKTGQSLIARTGIALEHENSWHTAGGDCRRLKYYGIGNLLFDTLDGTTVTVGATDISNRNDRFWGSLGLGGSFNWRNDRFSVYAEAEYRSSLEHSDDNYMVNMLLGFRMKF